MPNPTTPLCTAWHWFAAFLVLCISVSQGFAARIKHITADVEQEGNPAKAAFDADPQTKWAALGRGRWIQFEFYDPVDLSKIGIGFTHSERDYAFDIRASEDGEKWNPPIKFQSRGADGVKLYKIDPTQARAVRITVHGSDRNDWANIHTIQIDGVALEVAPASSRNDAYTVSEWASDPLIANTVGISIDDRGRAYVTVARRRKESSLDIRHYQDLVKKDLSLQTVEDRRAWYREYLTGKDWVPDRDGDGTRNWRDLTVQKDNVSQVSDANGDGKADSIVVLDDYHSEVTGIAAGVLAVGEDVFVAVEPDFLRYTDEDQNGLPETRQLVATGFQVHMGQGGHNMSGVTLGPDGRVYWSLGDKGHHVKTKEGKVYHSPNSGAIFRCEMDGSKVERYSTGERNAQELAFDHHGNLFSMDNDGDYPGEMERALYITEGSEHGWRLNWQWLRKQDFVKISGIPAYNPWMEEGLFLPDREDHAAYLTPTIGNFGPGPCGFTANPGTALSAALSDCFFMTNQKSEVRVIKFRENAASFYFEELPAIKGGTNNTGLAIGPDGGLYSASYGSKRGSIFRFDVAEADRHPDRADTWRILAIDSKKPTIEILKRWLDHPDQRVRMKGQFELVRRRSIASLNEALIGDANTRLGRIHAVWGIGQLAREIPGLLTFVQMAWNHEHEHELIAQAIKVIGDTPGDIGEIAGFRQKLLDGLVHESPRVRFFSAITVGNRGLNEGVPKLIEMLEQSGASDPYLRHAAVMGLTGTMTSEQLAGLSNHPNKSVRLGAIVALRKLSAPEIRAFLGDEDELVLLEAARAIHDDWSIPAALPDLAALLDREDLQNEALMRRVINAAFRHGSLTDLHLLESYLERRAGSAKLRRTALASILWWSQPPVLDPVEGRYRKHDPRDGNLANATVARLQPLIVDDLDLLEVLLNGVIERGEANWLGNTMSHFTKWPPELQVRALDALAKTDAPELKELVQLGLSSGNEKVREKSRAHAKRAGISTVDLLLAILEEPKPAGQGKAVLQLAEGATGLLSRPKQKLAQLYQAYRDGKADPTWKLELWQAAKSQGVILPETPDRLEFGGDPERGKKLVMEHAAAQCIRCHQVGDTAAAGTPISIGPSLTQIGAARDRAYLVASLLEPTRDIANGYGTILLKTKSGEELSGILSKKTEREWTITLADNSKQVIDLNEVESHTLTSVMPPAGLFMTPEEIRDVVSYLAELK